MFRVLNVNGHKWGWHVGRSYVQIRKPDNLKLTDAQKKKLLIVKHHNTYVSVRPGDVVRYIQENFYKKNNVC